MNPTYHELLEEFNDMNYKIKDLENELSFAQEALTDAETERSVLESFMNHRSRSLPSFRGYSMPWGFRI